METGPYSESFGGVRLGLIGEVGFDLQSFVDEQWSERTVLSDTEEFVGFHHNSVIIVTPSQLR